MPAKVEVYATILELRQALAGSRREGAKIGFVPTMGALHDGHAALIKRSAADNDITIVSIYVNPLQFGPGEDYERYPRTFESDGKLIAASGGTAVFAASSAEMYPDGYATYVDVERLTQTLCGASRPGHFRGVATVVAKLFNIVQPTRAYFGRKDFQQSVVIKRMVSDLNLPVEVIVCPTVREPDGLAMSSRNRYLSAHEREQALCLVQALRLARRKFAAGERRSDMIIAEMRGHIARSKDARVDYIAAVHPQTLAPVREAQPTTVMALAVHVGNTRLIDNMALGGNEE